MPPPLERAPDYLVLGHLTLDQTPAGAVLGGTAAYAALTARAHGLRAAIVTRPGTTSTSALSGTDVVRLPSAETTIFRNLDDATDDDSTYSLRAGEISDDAPAWRAARIVHLAPVAAKFR
jgi:hypothetical protein